MFARGKVDDAERLASIEADITALTARKHGYEQAAEDAAKAALKGLILSRDARLQQELAELMMGVLDDQLEEQWAAHDALLPRQREADDG